MAPFECIPGRQWKEILLVEESWAVSLKEETATSKSLYQASRVAQMVKNLPAVQETLVQSLGLEDPLRKEWLPTPVFLPGEFHGQRSLAGYSPWGRKESDMTEWLSFQYDIWLSFTFSWYYNF